MKTCIKCGDPDAEFHKNISKRDGLHDSCKSCRKISTAKYNADNRDKISEYNAKWRAENPEKKRENSAKWKAANPEKLKASYTKYWAANSDKINARNVKWATANPEAKRIHGHNRRAKKRENGGKLSPGLSAKLFKLQKGKCPCCKEPLGEYYHLDNIIPVDLGGANVDSNIQLLRAKCNQQKSAHHPVEFMQSRGFLL